MHYKNKTAAEAVSAFSTLPLKYISTSAAKFENPLLYVYVFPRTQHPYLSLKRFPVVSLKQVCVKIYYNIHIHTYIASSACNKWHCEE